ncbi:Neuron navigator 3 [Larimichthys crocea]|uniref:Neuron navigator 3 n=1 Tax=Larimichthys crocea TaxID=215358 RepID=A0A6G0HQS9_LARCR|nr:Neuron navigator 3 [Larimichthys crocea]
MKRGAEFSVYQGGSPARRPPQPLPDNLNLRIKQRSLTNLTLLSDGEQRVYSFELDEPPPRLSQPQSSLVYSSSTQRAGGSLQGSPRKEVVTRGGGARGTRARSLSLSLTKVLSQSEHSLIPVPWRCTGAGGRPQRASYSGHSRVELGRASREEGGTDEEGSSGRSDEEPAAGRGGGKRAGKEKDGGYWAEEEVSGGGPREGTAQLDKEVILTMLGDLEKVLHTQPRPREDPETRRMRTVKNIADLRQNLEETMSSLRGTQISHSTLETTFDTTVTTEVNGRSLPALTARSSPMAWRLGQSQTPRLQAGDAPSMPSSYAAPRASTTSAGTTTGRYSGHSDPSRFVFSAPLRRAAAAAGARGAEQGEKGEGGLEGGKQMEVAGYMSDGDILGKSGRMDEITSGYLTDGGLHLYARNAGRASDVASSREVSQRGSKEVQGDIDR